MAGLYIHVPFCAGKCPYCDFYSLTAGAGEMDAYMQRACEVLKGWAGTEVGTVYFGGGTPDLLGAERLAKLLGCARENFRIAPGAEVTLEANPTRVTGRFFEQLRRAGFNRLSMGLQSAHREELRLLGRAHTREQAAQAVRAAQGAGFANISLDVMLGLPGGSRERLGETLAFAAGLGVQHISAYILKIEPGTPFAARGVEVPDGDETADQYLFCVEELGRLGYAQYEISNFARPGFESRHNLTYWRGEEYVGVGPGAHSFWGGRRFYYPRSLEGFLQGGSPEEDGPGGGFEEFAMLNLRLSRGLLLTECAGEFGPEGERSYARLRQNAGRCPGHLVKSDKEKVWLTPEGFLVSNALLVRLLEGV